MTHHSDAISPERLDALQIGFVQTLDRYHVVPARCYPVFDRLVAALTEPNRHYHTIEHIAEMLKVVSKLVDAGTDIAAIRLAVWFHDAVHDPKVNDNEARSAILANDLLRPIGIPDDVRATIARMILATAHASDEPTDADTAILLDADLAILSAENKRYARYAADIRSEYDWVSEDQYRIGRSAVLASLLARPRIYRTQRMYSVAEEPARHNLQWELAQLQNADG